MESWKRVIAIGLACVPALASGAVLYKSVDANGIVTFSDMPPPAGSRLLEQRDLPGNPGAYAYVAPSQPSPMAEPGLFVPLLDADVALQQANAKVDEAERALAAARRAAGPTHGPVRLASARLSREDEARIEREKTNVRLARHRLMELLQERSRLALAR